MIITASRSISRAVHRLYCSHSHSHSHSTPLTKCLLQNYSKPRSIGECKQIHAKLIASGTILEVYLTNTLLNFYSRCGDISHTSQLFNQIPQKNVVTWTSMITAYVHRGSFETALVLFVEMIQSGEKPNQFTLSVVIRACTAISYIELGLQVQGLIIHLGLEKDEFAGSSLVDMYFKFGGFFEDACRIFNGLFRRDAVTWNVIISGFAHVHDSIEVCRLFSEMQVIDGLKPNDFTFTSLLKCCFYLREVEQIHGLVLKFGTESDVVVGSALVDLYGKCGNMGSGRKVLDAMVGKDGFVWSSVISGYARNDCGEEAVVLFRDMCRKGLMPDQHTFSCVLKACVEIKGIETGMQIHTQVIKNGYHVDCFVSSVLLNLYTDFNYMDEAEKVFRSISDKDLVAWNSMIMGYAVLPEGSTACIKLYREFRQTATLKPDEGTVIAILKSCQSQTDLDLGLQVHANIVKFNLSCETLVGNGVINMYSKCNAVDDARKAFNTMVHKDEATWNSIIGCYVQNGIQLEALKLCKEMLAVGIFLSCFSLPLCITASSALVVLDLGKQFHSSIIKFGFDRDVYIGSSVIDMYAKCGVIEDSIKVFHELCEPNVVIFNVLISGFAQHGRALEAIEVFKDMEKMNIVPNKITFLAVLSACSHVGLVEESILIFNLMCQSYGIEPEPEHYSCLVDAFGRAGRLEEASQLLQNSIGVSAWRTLLSACRNHGNLLIGEKSARKVMELEPNDHSSYVLLSNVYYEAGRWEEAMVLRQQMADIGVQKDPGNSWLMIRDQVHLSSRICFPSSPAASTLIW